MRPLLIILLLALLLRLGWGLTRPSSDAGLAALPDQVEYLSLAKNLLHDKTLVFVDDRFGTPSYAYRTPGYPLFLALCAAKPLLARLAQTLLDTSTIFAVYLLARRWGHIPALVAAGLTALCPFLIYFSGLLLTETLFTALLVWGITLLMWESGKTTTFLAGLFLLALSVIVRPGALALPLLLAMIAGMSRSTLPRLPVLASALAMLSLVLLPWGWRNYSVLNEWVFTSTNAGVTAYDGANPSADGSSNQAAFIPHMPELGEMTETQRNDYLSQLAAQWRSDHPWDFASLALVKAGRTWSPIPLSDTYRSLPTILAGLLYSLLAWPLALVGLWKTRGSPGYRLLLLTPAIYLTTSAMLSVGSLRYRLPAEPLLAVLSAAGVAVLLAKPAPPTPQPTFSSQNGPQVSYP